jgi:hypothetical protein
MVTQVDEQQSAVVTLAVNPARKAGLRTGVAGAQGTAGMGAIDMHETANKIRKFVAP